MLIDTDQIQENAAKVQGLEQRLKSLESWLDKLKVDPVHKTPTEWTMPAGDPADDGLSGEPQGKVITFSGDGFHYSCAPFAGEPVGDDEPVAKKPGFSPFGRDDLVIANESKKTQTYTVTIAAGKDDVAINVVRAEDLKVMKNLTSVPAGKCQTRTFDLEPGQALSSPNSGSYKIEAVN